jgi:hypothetical protein
MLQKIWLISYVCGGYFIGRKENIVNCQVNHSIYKLRKKYAYNLFHFLIDLKNYCQNCQINHSR